MAGQASCICHEPRLSYEYVLVFCTVLAESAHRQPQQSCKGTRSPVPVPDVVVCLVVQNDLGMFLISRLTF